MTTVTFYTKEDCTLCEPVWFVLKKLQSRCGYDLQRVDISDSANQEAYNLYCHDIPVVFVNGEEFCRHRLSERALREHLDRLGVSGGDGSASKRA